MGAHSHADLAHHVGHELECAVYGDGAEPENVAVECMDCCEVLCDADRDPDNIVDRTPEQRRRYEHLLRHRGHRIPCVSRPVTGAVAVTCRTFGIDLLAFERGEG
jgi:hypothetical protein